jgi:UDP-N-acetylglucosamine--N-acetylmuramyl-(pentapeptide) pyrophosphoryl-undecaprenol N-acetylglucosamine transferase
MTTIVLAGGGTGGHLMPALAIAAATAELRPEWRFVFAGAERGIESSVLPARGVPHHLLPLQPLHRRHWWKNLTWPLRWPGLVRSVDRMLDAERPAAVIGTGGYVAGPVLWRAAVRGGPTGILELDVRPGIATRLLAGRVREIWLGAPEARDALSVSAQQKATFTGAPIIPPDVRRRAAALRQFGVDGSRPVVVITGGSQGSLAINRVVAAWAHRGHAAGVDLVWATGRGTHAEFAGLHAPPHLQVIPFIDPMADAWAIADVCIARAGMMTLAELCAWGIPSILIPLPTAAADHQTFNARAMESAAAAIMLPQAGLTAASLQVALGGLLADPRRRAALSDRARARGRPDAARVIAERVMELASGANVE